MKTYDPKQILIIFGVHQLQGFADGSMVTVRRNSDAWSLQMGVDGEGTRSKSNDKSGQVEVSLMQTSESNDYLSQVALADELENAGVQPLLIKDANGTSLYAAEQAYVKKISDSAYGRESQERTWIIETDNLQMHAGGN